MKISSAKFISSSTSLAQCPNKKNIPEYAFIGRSNVGKSSLINFLTNSKVAKTSSTPGKTQLINHFLINEFQNKVKCDSWFVEFVYGSFEQQPCLLFGEEIRLTVIARRSRHFAGTRYLKRGISDDGKVANDVEVEQIIEHVGDGRITSHVQNRGSIPVFWTQKTSFPLSFPILPLPFPV